MRSIVICLAALAACGDDRLDGVPEEPVAPQSTALVTAEPGSHDFGPVPLPESRTTTITVTNAGTLDVVLDSVVFEPAVAFSAPLLDVVPLAPGQQHALAVTFTPLISDAYGARLRLIAPPAPDVFVSLAGRGANCPAESCNGIDDDCDGQTDEEGICAVEFVTSWYLLDDGSVHETVSSPAYVVDHHGDPDLYWYEPSGAHGLLGSSNPQADFATMRAYVLSRAQSVTPDGPFNFDATSTLATFAEATFTYVMCELHVPVGDDPNRYRVRAERADDGIQLMVNGAIVGRQSLGDGPLEWVLTLVPGEVNTMIVILVDDSQVQKILTGLGFYRDGVFVQ